MEYFLFLWYLDFGWMGIVFMFIFGYFAKKVWANVYYLHNILYLPLLCFYPSSCFLFCN